MVDFSISGEDFFSQSAFDTLCVANGARVVGVLHIVENLSHPSGRDFCFRMREVPDPRILESHRQPEWRSSRGLKGTVVGPALSLGGRKGWMAGYVCCEGVGSRCEGAKGTAHALR